MNKLLTIPHTNLPLNKTKNRMPNMRIHYKGVGWPELMDYFQHRTLKLGIPVFANLEITKKCNFTCVHCHTLPSSRNQKKEMTYSEICSVIDQLADMGTILITITGGEPLVRPDLWKILKYARKREFSVRLNTNGSLITEDIAKRISELYLADVAISIYGADEQTYKAVTGSSGSFKKIFHSVELLIKNKVRVILKTPILTQNYHQIKLINDFAKKINVNYQPALAINACFDGCLDPLGHIASEKQLKELFDSLPQLCRPLRPAKPAPSDQMCGGGIGLIAISAYGEVMPCTLLRSKTTFRKKPIAEFLKNDPLFKTVKKIKWRDLSKCLNCKALLYCRPCIGSFFFVTGSFYTPDQNSICKLAWARKKTDEKKQHHESSTK